MEVGAKKLSECIFSIMIFGKKMCRMENGEWSIASQNGGFECLLVMNRMVRNENHE